MDEINYESVFMSEYMHPNLEVTDRDALFSKMAENLKSLGVVKDSFLDAVIAREKIYPTGLPINGGVAIPHTDPEHVVKSAISIDALTKPVGFKEMAGSNEDEIPVQLVFLLALTGEGQHLAVLQSIVKCLQKPEFVEAARAQKTPEDLAAFARKNVLTGAE